MTSKKISSRKPRESMFQKEYETVDHVEDVQNRDSLDPDVLLEEYRFLGRRYQKLLREMKKITRIGDVNYKKLLDANDQIGKQKSELEVLNLRLTEAKATQDRLYSIIAHDLRNPLQFLLFTSDVLHCDYENLEESAIRNYIGKVFKTVQNTSDLLENLLQWSVSQYGHLECRPHPIKYNQLVADLLDLFQHNAEKKNIALESDLPERFQVYADEDMIKSVLRNLVSNALKFTHPGGRVLVSVRRKQDKIYTAVTDTGLGIPPQRQETLFNMGLNTTTTGTAKEKGTGLGLILCKELIEKNNGEIRITSQVEKGSCFEFSLPSTSA